jgi:predicted outer membrane protein
VAKMIADHQIAVELFESEARDGKDDALRTWARAKLPTLNRHLEMARDLQAKLAASSDR